jgi:hypothetical protein
MLYELKNAQKQICTLTMPDDFKGIEFSKKLNGVLYTGLGRTACN